MDRFLIKVSKTTLPVNSNTKTKIKNFLLQLLDISMTIMHSTLTRFTLALLALLIVVIWGYGTASPATSNTFQHISLVNHAMRHMIAAATAYTCQPHNNVPTQATTTIATTTANHITMAPFQQQQYDRMTYSHPTLITNSNSNHTALNHLSPSHFHQTQLDHHVHHYQTNLSPRCHSHSLLLTSSLTLRHPLTHHQSNPILTTTNSRPIQQLIECKCVPPVAQPSPSPTGNNLACQSTPTLICMQQAYADGSAPLVPEQATAHT